MLFSLLIIIKECKLCRWNRNNFFTQYISRSFQSCFKILLDRVNFPVSALTSWRISIASAITKLSKMNESWVNSCLCSGNDRMVSDLEFNFVYFWCQRFKCYCCCCMDENPTISPSDKRSQLCGLCTLQVPTLFNNIIISNQEKGNTRKAPWYKLWTELSFRTWQKHDVVDQKSMHF